jgi:hypothetical protein
MPVTIWLTATNSVALPRVYNQFIFGTFRKNMALHTPRQPILSSSHFPGLIDILTSQNVELIVFDFYLILVKRSRRRTGYYSPILAKDSVVTGTKKQLIVNNPAHAAAQVRTDI